MNEDLNLLDSNVPLQERYDKFLNWANQNSVVATNLVAEKLSINVAHVEVYYDLGKIENESEFQIIDSKKISLDSLVLILKEEENTRQKIYNEYETS